MRLRQFQVFVCIWFMSAASGCYLNFIMVAYFIVMKTNQQPIKDMLAYTINI